jgi:hypothetical protein
MVSRSCEVVPVGSLALVHPFVFRVDTRGMHYPHPAVAGHVGAGSPRSQMVAWRGWRRLAKRTNLQSPRFSLMTWPFAEPTPVPCSARSGRGKKASHCAAREAPPPPPPLPCPCFLCLPPRLHGTARPRTLSPHHTVTRCAAPSRLHPKSRHFSAHAG